MPGFVADHLPDCPVFRLTSLRLMISIYTASASGGHAVLRSSLDVSFVNILLVCLGATWKYDA